MKYPNIIGRITVAILLLSCAQPAYSKVIPSELLFSGDTFNQLSISPDGKHILSLSFIKSKYRVEVFPSRGEEAYTIFSLAQTGKAVIHQAVWIDNDSLVIRYTSFEGKTAHLLVDLDKRDKAIKFDRQKSTKKGYIVDPLPHIDDKVIFAYKVSGKNRNYDVRMVTFRCLDLSRCKSKKSLNAGMYQGSVFVTDLQHRVRLAVVSHEDRFSLYHQGVKEDGWTRILQPVQKNNIFIPQGFLTKNTIAAVSNYGRDRRALVEYDLATRRTIRTIMEPDEGEVLNAALDPHSGNVLFAKILAHGRVHTHYLSSTNRTFKTLFKKAFPGKDVIVVSRSLNQKDILLLVLAADDPGTVYHYNVASRTARPIMAVLPFLQGYRMAKNILIQQTSKEGYKIDAFLTLPLKERKDYPLIVMPHGGPIGVADYDLFHREVQFFASRGYAVLRVNFRGSTGYGKEFMDSGRGEWGKKIEDDINEIVKTVKNKHPIRPDNSCIIGASYGGYSALISSIRFPRQYRCAVSYFGVTDIPLILSSGNVLKNESVRDSILHVVGDPKMEGIDHVAVSPVYLVDKLDVPVLLMAGWRDRIADAEHSHRLHYMMKKHGKNSQFILYRHASHGHESWFGDMHQNITIDAFLRHYLDVPLPEDEEEKKVLREEWYVAGTLLGKKNRIADRNEEMSLLLLRQAAKAGHERAQQELEKNNLGSR